MMNTVDMFGLSVSCFTLEEAAEKLSELAQSGKTSVVFTANTEAIVMMSTNGEFRTAYKNADYVFPDGMPLVWFSRIIGERLPERVTGADLLPELCRIAEKKNLRIFFLGGTPEVTPIAVLNLLKRFPTLQVAGIATPWINLTDQKDLHSDLVNLINGSNSDIVFIGFGVPKQEIWIARNQYRLKTGVILSVGGSFDFMAGKTIRAPLWMQKSGLEWLWRLLYEPKRLWKRYLIGNIRFLRIAWIEWQKQKSK
jgi:N-acetylglucosaminyldiphosphoundecaprenol N-acetyl-beta-D-mannosaminyltransferase